MPINQVEAWLGDDPRTVLRVYAHVLGEAQDMEALHRLNATLPSRSPGTANEHEPSEGGAVEQTPKTGSDQEKLAETRGFEPLVPLRGLHLSRVVHSAGLCDVSSHVLVRTRDSHHNPATV